MFNTTMYSSLPRTDAVILLPRTERSSTASRYSIPRSNDRSPAAARRSASLQPFPTMVATLPFNNRPLTTNAERAVGVGPGHRPSHRNDSSEQRGQSAAQVIQIAPARRLAG